MLDQCLIGTIEARGSCLIRARGSCLIGARGYGYCLIGAREISDLIDACGSELGRSRSNLIGVCGSELGRLMLDWVLPDRSCGLMLVTKMVWIRPRGRVDLCSEMGIEMGIKREQQIKKKRVERERERERECVCVCVCM